jgi:redox-sensitive bicupin YhaK (pirin superfamily)
LAKQARQNDKSSLSGDTKLKNFSNKNADGKVSAKVIAGKALNVNAVIKTRTPMLMYFHFALQPKSEIEQQVPSEYNNAFA